MGQQHSQKNPTLKTRTYLYLWGKITLYPLHFSIHKQCRYDPARPDSTAAQPGWFHGYTRYDPSIHPCNCAILEGKCITSMNTSAPVSLCMSIRQWKNPEKNSSIPHLGVNKVNRFEWTLRFTVTKSNYHVVVFIMECIYTNNIVTTIFGWKLKPKCVLSAFCLFSCKFHWKYTCDRNWTKSVSSSADSFLERCHPYDIQGKFYILGCLRPRS